jgi:hypothetical protein
LTHCGPEQLQHVWHTVQRTEEAADIGDRGTFQDLLPAKPNSSSVVRSVGVLGAIIDPGEVNETLARSDASAQAQYAAGCLLSIRGPT